MRDQNINPAWNHPPFLDQLFVCCVVGKTRQIGTPWRAVNQKSSNLDRAVFEKSGMREAELPALKEKIMITPDTNDMLCGSLSKPDVGIVKGSLLFTSTTAEVTAVNE